MSLLSDCRVSLHYFFITRWDHGVSFEDTRAKKKEEERVEPPKAILFYQEGLENKAVWKEIWTANS
jgi:hypothetical protein